MSTIGVAHVLYRFAIGGLENGVVNLVNRLPPDRYRHYIICLTDYDPRFAARIVSGNCELFALGKREGQDFAIWGRAHALLRRLRPRVLHTRNFAALEIQLPGIAAGVPGRVHGEHGWDVQDLDGSNRKHRLVRRVLGCGVQRFIALSRQIEDYLVGDVGIAPSRVVQIYNGVDDAVFAPRPRDPARPIVIGTVGRMKTVKNQTFLVEGFVRLVAQRPELRDRLRLRLVGSGPLLALCQRSLAAAGLAERADIVGESDRVAEELNEMDLFVLPSLAEGISNTLLEAMAAGLPVVATATGGNPELVVDGVTGSLIGVNDVEALVAALAAYVDDPARRARHGAAARERVERAFSLSTMVDAYDEVYRALAH